VSCIRIHGDTQIFPSWGTELAIRPKTIEPRVEAA